MKMSMVDLEDPAPRRGSSIRTEDMTLECVGSFGKVIRKVCVLVVPPF